MKTDDKKETRMDNLTPIETPQPAPTDPDPLTDLLQLDASVTVTLAEMQTWPADRIDRFFHGIAMVQTALAEARREIQ